MQCRVKHQNQSHYLCSYHSLHAGQGLKRGKLFDEKLLKKLNKIVIPQNDVEGGWVGREESLENVQPHGNLLGEGRARNQFNPWLRELVGASLNDPSLLLGADLEISFLWSLSSFAASQLKQITTLYLSMKPAVFWKFQAHLSAWGVLSMAEDTGNMLNLFRAPSLFFYRVLEQIQRLHLLLEDILKVGPEISKRLSEALGSLWASHLCLNGISCCRGVVNLFRRQEYFWGENLTPLSFSLGWWLPQKHHPLWVQATVFWYTFSSIIT